MITVSRSVLLFLFGSLLAGCASLINGSTQEVPVKIPEGTIVSDWQGLQIPVIRQANYSDSCGYIKLHRSKKYELRFDYHGQSIETVFSSAVEPGWIPFDVLFYIVPVIIDLATQNMNSFDGIAIHFSNDATDPKRTGQTYIEPFDPGQLFDSRQGLSLQLMTGRNDPKLNGEFLLPFPNDVGFGIGYAITNRLSAFGTYHFTSGLDLTPKNYKKSYTALSNIQLEGRCDLIWGFSIGVGAGISNVQIDRPYYDSAGFRIVQPDVSKTMPILTPFLGYYGSVSFIELRYFYGLSEIAFQNTDRIKIQMLSLNYGLHFHL